MAKRLQLDKRQFKLQRNSKNNVLEKIKKRNSFLNYKKVFKFISLFITIFIAVYVVLNFPALFSKLKYWLGYKNPISLHVTNKNDFKLSEPNPNSDRLLIPKINVNTPIIFTESNEKDKISENLKNGVVHYTDTALPGEQGNSFITGHSSQYFWEGGNYQTVFALLDELLQGDEIIIYFKGQKYTYKVFEKVIVGDKETEVLNPTDKSIVSLMTCWPIGTTFKRLIVRGELVR